MSADPIDRSTHAADESLLSIDAFALWIGVSSHTVRKWTAKGPTTGLVPRMLRINCQIRFRPSDVREWLDSKEIR